MTAHRPRRNAPLDEIGLFEALFYGVPAQRAGRRGSLWVPPTDVYETEDLIVVQIEIAGVQQADFTVTLTDRHLIVAGTRPDRGPTRRAYHQMEVHYGDFRAEVELPMPVDERRVDAEYSDGFLRIVLPKKKSQVIDIRE
jgi:HSP20 family protein